MNIRFWLGCAALLTLLTPINNAFAQIGQASPHQMTIGQPTPVINGDIKIPEQKAGLPSAAPNKLQHSHVVPPSQVPATTGSSPASSAAACSAN
jgi:hypothetical protein